MSGEEILAVNNLKKYFPIRGGILLRTIGHVLAVDGVTFKIRRGETLGLVGESGCGKTTVGKTVLKLLAPTAGEIRLKSRDITHLHGSQLRSARREMQMIFQDPYSSLNPRMSARDIVAEPMENYGLASGREKRERAAALLERVGFRAGQMAKRPHEFSGGQRQRIGIARALALNPSLIVADEPVSALDVSIQAQVINLLMDLQNEFHLAYLFISHDLAVVKHISHRIAVMYLGKVVELTDMKTLFAAPLHPYTEALLGAVPIPNPRADRKVIILEGDIPSPITPPPGCRFHTRCPYVFDRCPVEEPPLIEVTPRHWAACHLRQPEGRFRGHPFR
ncbi:MAG: ATP-binding cassette domain-containing protein [Desulfobacterales bacterium]|nr:MAG: ATP-binding cassette domain-containing protein [Desulfobacterales bacterium]